LSQPRGALKSHKLVLRTEKEIDWNKEKLVGDTDASPFLSVVEKPDRPLA